MNLNKSNQILVFSERGKLEYPGKTSQSRVENQQTQATHCIESGIEPGNIGGGFLSVDPANEVGIAK